MRSSIGTRLQQPTVQVPSHSAQLIDNPLSRTVALVIRHSMSSQATLDGPQPELFHQNVRLIMALFQIREDRIQTLATNKAVRSTPFPRVSTLSRVRHRIRVHFDFKSRRNKAVPSTSASATSCRKKYDNQCRNRKPTKQGSSKHLRNRTASLKAYANKPSLAQSPNNHGRTSTDNLFKPHGASTC